MSALDNTPKFKFGKTPPTRKNMLGALINNTAWLRLNMQDECAADCFTNNGVDADLIAEKYGLLEVPKWRGLTVEQMKIEATNQFNMFMQMVDERGNE